MAEIKGGIKLRAALKEIGSRLEQLIQTDSLLH